MCNSNPQVERLTTWGYTHEEILHRWNIWQKFDIVTRIFGPGKKEENEENEESKTPVNTQATLVALANIFGPNFMNQPSEETISNG